MSRSFVRSNGRPYTRPGQLLKPERLKQGYLRVTMSARGETTRKTVHSIVLEAFVGPRPEGYVTCHWNDISDDNRLENLRWGTQSENGDDMVRNGNGVNSRKTHCPKGHPYDKANTKLFFGTKSGRPYRYCRICSNTSRRIRYKSMTQRERAEWSAKQSAAYYARKAK